MTRAFLFVFLHNSVCFTANGHPTGRQRHERPTISKGLLIVHKNRWEDVFSPSISSAAATCPIHHGLDDVGTSHGATGNGQGITDCTDRRVINMASKAQQTNLTYAKSVYSSFPLSTVQLPLYSTCTSSFSAQFTRILLLLACSCSHSSTTVLAVFLSGITSFPFCFYFFLTVPLRLFGPVQNTKLAIRVHASY